MQDGRLEISDPRLPNGRWDTQNERGGIEMRDRDERCEMRDARCEMGDKGCERADEGLEMRDAIRDTRCDLRDAT